MKDRASRGKVELLLTNLLKGGHILHDQYNTRHAVPAIPDEIRGEIRREPSKSKIQQKPVIYLLLAGPLGWQCGAPGLPVPTSPQPSQSAQLSQSLQYTQSLQSREFSQSSQLLQFSQLSQLLQSTHFLQSTQSLQSKQLSQFTKVFDNSTASS